MPNWITNKLTINADNETLERIIAEVRNGDKPFDFEKVIPMPDNVYKGNLGPEEEKLYGKNNWYDWSIDNWGTKWNACHNNEDDIVEIFNGKLVYEFDTAWAAPFPVALKLSEKYKCACTLEYYDEDFGYNCGCFVCDNGAVDTDFHADATTKESALEWIADAFGDETMEAHGYYLVNNKWQFKMED